MNLVEEGLGADEQESKWSVAAGWEEGDPWSVPLTIDPRPFVFMNRTLARDVSQNRGRPFVGVGMKGNVLSAVFPESPAEAAGLRVGDKLLSFHGHAVTQLADLSEALQGLAAGTEVELEYQRDGAAMKKRIKLADYYDAVEVKEAREGTALPDLTGMDINSREVRLRDFQGKVVLVDFWATWCGPCLEELPLHQLLWEKAKDGDFVWIGVSVDDDKEAWENFVRNNGLGGIQLRNADWAASLYVSGFPTILLVDRSGIIRCKLRGRSVAQAVTALMAEK
jgi:thiol-disulfide isomerase/thioredoxin